MAKQWQAEASAKSSLKYLNIDSIQVGKVQNSWTLTSNSVRDVRRAHIKVKLLTVWYILQSNRSKFNKYTFPSTCLLCKIAPEDLKHFLLECPQLQPVRMGHGFETEQIHLQTVPDGAAQLLADTELLCRTTMDCTVLGESISGEPLDVF